MYVLLVFQSAKDSAVRVTLRADFRCGGDCVCFCVGFDACRSFYDDTYILGRIAATHALSDCYAMGAEPMIALLTAVIPHGSDHVVSSGAAVFTAPMSVVSPGPAFFLLALSRQRSTPGRETWDREVFLQTTWMSKLVHGQCAPRCRWRATGMALPWKP